jgi:predicted RNA-binding Zn ribbon-like protein
LSWSKNTPGERCSWRDDDALGAVDDEGAGVGHQRDLAEVDLLLLHVADRLDAGLLVDVPHHQADDHLDRRGEGHAAGAALVDVVLGLLEVVRHELEGARLGEVLDREDALEHALQADVLAPIERISICRNLS